MIQNKFINALVVNITHGYFGDTHNALNFSFGHRLSFLLPMTRNICVAKAQRELNNGGNK